MALLSISSVLYPDLEFLDVYLHERYIPSFVIIEVITAVFWKSSLLGCYILLLGQLLLTFGSKVVPSSSGLTSPGRFLTSGPGGF